MIQDKAQELGRLIGQTEEYKAVMRATDAINGDEEAMQLRNSIEALRQRAQEVMNGGQEPPPGMEDELNQLLAQMQANAAYQKLIVAEENLDKVMRRVNEWISEGIAKGSRSPIITLG